MKNLKKIFGILFAMVALTFVMSISIFAAEYTAASGSELTNAYGSASDGDTIKLTANVSIEYLKIEEAITLDLNDFTLTTTNGYSGLRLYNNCSVINGKLVHSGKTCAIKVWNVDKIEDVDIECTYNDSEPKIIGGIVIQDKASARINTIKNVTITGVGLTNGIETYNCGTATQPVIGCIENVTVTAKENGILLSAPIGTVKDSAITGGVTGINARTVDPNWSTTITLENTTVTGNTQALLITDAGSGGTMQIASDAKRTYTSTGTPIVANVVNYGNVTLALVGYKANSNGTFEKCTNHTYQETERVNATCVAPGYAKSVCDCGVTKEETLAIDPEAHDYESVVTEPTCTEDGYTTYTCKNATCGHTYEEAGETKLGHDMVTDAAVAATCTKTGLTEGSHCSRCDDATTAQTEVPALGHAMVTDAAVAATCTETGLTEGSHCSRCDEKVAQEVVAALGHKYDNACDANCNVCDEARTPAEHKDDDANNLCDACGAELPKKGLSGGAIAGIAIGAVAVVGVGGFAISKFVLKKKKK
jgi:hypothetical protein